MKTIRFWILDFGFWISKSKIILAAASVEKTTLPKAYANPKSKIQNPKSPEFGGALVGLLALMTVMAIVLLAVAPSLHQEIRRQKEIEAIHRGDEIARAIQLYAFYNNGQLPRSMNDLLEGVKIPGRTKPLLILRKSAAVDPLSSSGEWKLVQSNDKMLIDYQRKVMNFNNGVTPPNPPPAQVFDQFARQIISSINTETTEDTEAPGGEDESDNVEGPFIGVVSRSQRKSVLTFYDIERHDRWVFTPLFRGAAANTQFPVPDRNRGMGRDGQNSSNSNR